MQNLIQSYNIKVNEVLNENKNKLLESFVIYYGEEYRDFITHKFNNISFCWGITDYLKNIFKDDSKVKDFNELKLLCELYNLEVLGFTDSSHVKYANSLKCVLDTNKKMTAFNSSFLDNDKIVEIIYFDMFLSSDKDIIHEINHYLTTSNLAILDKKLVQSVGLSSYGKEKRLFEELINEKSAFDITEIFKSLNGNLNWSGFPIKINSNYERFFSIIESFYDKYKEILKIVRISENTNELFKYVDKEIYEKYVMLVDGLIKHYNSSIPEEYINLCNSLVYSMDKSKLKK